MKFDYRIIKCFCSATRSYWFKLQERIYWFGWKTIGIDPLGIDIFNWARNCNCKIPSEVTEYI